MTPPGNTNVAQDSSGESHKQTGTRVILICLHGTVNSVEQHVIISWWDQSQTTIVVQQQHMITFNQNMNILNKSQSCQFHYKHYHCVINLSILIETLHVKI